MTICLQEIKAKEKTICLRKLKERKTICLQEEETICFLLFMKTKRKKRNKNG